jgi:hypothetical protein
VKLRQVTVEDHDVIPVHGHPFQRGVPS